MRGSITIIFLISCFLGLSIRPGSAQEEEVRAAMVESLSAWSEGDFQKLGTFFAGQTRGYMLGGTVLVTGFNPQALEAAISAGFSFEIEPREIDILMVGETVAVAVAMIEGTITLPGGGMQHGPWQYSETRVLEGGQWRVIQYHFSPVSTGGSTEGRRAAEVYRILPIREDPDKRRTPHPNSVSHLPRGGSRLSTPGAGKEKRLERKRAAFQPWDRGRSDPQGRLDTCLANHAPEPHRWAAGRRGPCHGPF